MPLRLDQKTESEVLRMKNSFLDDLCAALENQEPTEDLMKEATGSGDPDLPAQQKAMDDETGNTAAPGDPNANPVAKPDPDRNPNETDTDAQKDSSLPNAEHVPAPGDDNGNPDPTAPGIESNLCGAAVDMHYESAVEGFLDRWMKHGRKNAKQMSVDDLVAAYIAAMKASGTKFSDDMEKLKDMFAPSVQAEPDIPRRYAKIDGAACVIEEDETYGLFLTYLVDGASRLRSVRRNDMVATVGRYLDAQEKAARKTGNGPATEMEGFSEDTLTGFKANVDLHKNRNTIPLAQEKAAKDPSGNTGDPATDKRTPVSPSGDTKPVALDKFINESYDKSGHTETPGVNGTPVSKSGDSKELGKNQFEKTADDKDGNPPSPGVDGDPDPSLDSFIAACEQMKTSGTPGVVMLPENMTLESYAMELGMGVIAMKAMEASLTAAEKRALKDSDFGLPEQRGWPLHDESHVRSAITNFHWCAQENQRELAKNILKAIRKFDMKDMQISEANPFSKYCPREWVVPRKKPERKAKAAEG